ncbi:ATP11 protein-domain-containing protein [Gymnopilus junonius]|uniref:ATP11 protein-domain-containing protein n=1 Tax=Gymnopilus junonius TaxID=109634 RepID=A0A9P5TV66_GYMJU|nr:ATP11 protein-domain-containing protein [Gymnopilus junonius]
MATRLLSRWVNASVARPCTAFKRAISNGVTDYQSKYTQQLHQRADKLGLTVSQLLEKAKADDAERRKAEGEKLKASAAALQKTSQTTDSSLASSSSLRPVEDGPSKLLSKRKDASPIKPLSSILNIPRILSTPHTAEQISALWTAYHGSRSGGTGRGYVCASIPLDMFHKMARTGRQYPTFVLPLPRVRLEDATETSSGENELAHEFFYPAETCSSSNPSCATVLFAPLQEYKLRGAFATPYLVLTMYTDLVSSHGLVLLRGEITPSSSGDKHMLGQEDAQALTLSLQRFYLWDDKKESEDISEGKRLLQAFHETPEKFEWQDLLRFSKTLP